MDSEQFFIDNKEAIETIKKRAKIRALNIFAGINLLSAWMFGDGFYVLLPFTIFAGFSIYSYTKQLFLHRKFPDKFRHPKLETSNYESNSSINTNENNSYSTSTNPYDAKSTLFSTLNYTSIRRDN